MLFIVTLKGNSSREKRSAAAGNFSLSMAVSSCRVWDPDINDWIELGDVVGLSLYLTSEHGFKRVICERDVINMFQTIAR